MAGTRTARVRSIPGFTLIELLTVVGIVGVLTALLLPAVQAAREASRRTACKNHLSQLAKGMIQHESQFRFLPTGGWTQKWIGTGERGTDASQPGGWTFTILPFVEETALHDSVARLVSSDQAQDAYEMLCTTPVPLFNCASRRSVEPVPTDEIQYFNTEAVDADVTVWISEATRCDYAASGGTVGACLGGVTVDAFLKKVPLSVARQSNKRFLFAHYANGNPSNCQSIPRPLSAIVGSGNGNSGHIGHDHDHFGPCIAPGEEATCNEIVDVVTQPIYSLEEGDDLRKKTVSQRILEDDANDGIADLQDGMISRMSQVRVGSVLDGMSNVYLLGEKYVAASKYDSGTDSGDASILYAGYSASNVRWATYPPTQDEADAERPSAFGSSHAGGWNAAFGDGSVRTMSYDIDPEVHKNLAAKAPRFSGEVLPAF